MGGRGKAESVIEGEHRGESVHRHIACREAKTRVNEHRSGKLCAA